MIRNFIDIIGITSESDLPDKINNQVIQYSETETIYISENRHKIRNIIQIKFKVDILSDRVIDSPLGKVVVLEGKKNFKIKINEGETHRRERDNVIEFDIPYNTFFELPKSVSAYEAVDIYILDAYFHLLDSRRLYSHILYLVNPRYSSNNNYSDNNHPPDSNSKRVGFTNIIYTDSNFNKF